MWAAISSEDDEIEECRLVQKSEESVEVATSASLSGVVVHFNEDTKADEDIEENAEISEIPQGGNLETMDNSTGKKFKLQIRRKNIWAEENIDESTKASEVFISIKSQQNLQSVCVLTDSNIQDAERPPTKNTSTCCC